MDISMFDIYLVMQADTFRELFKMGMLFFFVWYIVWGAIHIISEGEVREPNLKFFLPIVIISGLLFTVTPKTTTLVAMYGIPTIINNEEVQKVPTKAVQALNKLFDSYIVQEQN